MPYDEDGVIAARGIANPSLLLELMSQPYFSLEAPKSTGRELFGAQAVAHILAAHPDMPGEDLVRTLTEFTAQSVADACLRLVEPRIGGPIDRLIVGGGGAHNPVMVGEIARRLPRIEVLTQEDLGVSSDAKEAIAFAILGNETLHGRPSNVPSATGARSPVVLGTITPPQGGLVPWVRG